MSKYSFLVPLSIAAAIAIPATTFAQSTSTHQMMHRNFMHTHPVMAAKRATKKGIPTWTVKVTAVSGSTVTATAKNVVYTIDDSSATTTRRYGGKMMAADIQVNDQLEVRGTLNGTSIAATWIQDNSLQAKNGTFVGVVKSIDATNYSLSFQSRARGMQTVTWTSTTTVKKNGQPAQASDIVVGSTLRATGVWDRTNHNLTASNIDIIVKMGMINVSGSVSAINGSSLTVMAHNGKTYTVDASKARVSQVGTKGATLSNIMVGNMVQVHGTHAATSMDIMAGMVRDMTKASAVAGSATSTQ